MGSDTITTQGDGPDEPSAEHTPYIALAFQGARPMAPLARVWLRRASELLVGRGSEQSVGPSGIFLPDLRLSKQHARFVRTERVWSVEDLGSKNGTRLNGEPLTRRQVLRDGDTVELGSCVLVFRSRPIAPTAAAPDDADAPCNVPSASWGGPFATLSPQLAHEFEQLAIVARSTTPILLCGETGTGKELTARAIHELSARTGPWVAVNCGAIRDTLVESELFGHKKGAFSGAVEDKLGYVRTADGGTLFLDEIAELVADSQVALLRVLEEGEVVPVGATRPIPVNVRFVAATHQDLAARIIDGRFRRDLYGRLNGYRIVLPPLRERREDLGILVASILSTIAGEAAARVRFRSTVARALFRYDWPQNIRELRNALRSAYLLAGDGEIRVEHLPEEMRLTVARPATVVLARDEQELRARLVALLAEHAGNVSAVARALGYHRTQVRRWIARFGLNAAEFAD